MIWFAAFHILPWLPFWWLSEET
ncbi:hypothetical protein CcrColossus_gp113 [Caulobacter phage CcrColossus]|uniref:Uncharacterized protein n=1 Tax=Caulobacter phage CcrColossus TaxID=1211640 RepID=K4JVU6_9CAUD|nr:hypothetical protein CcrColossus_gp113 [Caulobacter phage CcrColossus]AFU87983.1 hypothetical protein CcrColossus_gp113 [Caulobacter phage CcrColossus]